jgi:hypothetical protein
MLCVVPTGRSDTESLGTSDLAVVREYPIMSAVADAVESRTSRISIGIVPGATPVLSPRHAIATDASNPNGCNSLLIDGGTPGCKRAV